VPWLLLIIAMIAIALVVAALWWRRRAGAVRRRRTSGSRAVADALARPAPTRRHAGDVVVGATPSTTTLRTVSDERA
jgi:FtsZ-interacting cell division protein ZipA